MSPTVTAIIAAAGSGTRLGAPMPKAYVPLRGVTLLERSITAMLTSQVVDAIVVTVSPDMEDYARTLLRKRGLDGEVTLVHGGAERADSVWRGLQAITHEQGVVLVHDSARALTPPGMIARVARAVVQGAPAVIPVLPVADTIKEIREVDGQQQVASTPDRSTLRAVQTPQGFDLAVLREANRAYFAQPSFVATDDASLMEWFGVPVRCVQGDPMAFKVTTPMDMLLATQVTDSAESTIFEVPSD
ncbi:MULTISPECIES: 2-C-methyl-D-erythritol 4-phosphate cytidylyltransferase [Corynebacterium]|uniref:2-C-methyl-D-erythritol 4-phosphate cytidylyltransferase n=1 Tax=Corynebacterium TaxID=1716 RepID=UPI00124EDE68|nr:MULTISPECIES: 2-C-methyl-D-erythritol 4-phosphate cytidylyltransferase [Corynebacterium]MBV7281952.1 2-C-methyl-D-erythritol 4-phosphate cytidylyltransferase [Corynebacterium sp. TAE3-ERU30]MBV7301585.1 2-C-methyl-D-erythritol 4-phosphate cytidylyltransferase [Corynebacterium sp. TAE3-ERU2]